MSQRLRFFACVILPPLSLTCACAAAREPHVVTSPRTVGSASNTNVVDRPDSSAQLPSEPAPLSCVPRVEVSKTAGEDSWLTASNGALCCRFEGYVSTPPNGWAGGRDCLTAIVPGLRPNAVFRAEMPLPYEMRLPFGAAVSALSTEQRQALDQLLQSRQGRSGSAPIIRPVLPEDHFAEHVRRARQLAQLSLEHLRSGGLPQTKVAAEGEWRGARGSTPFILISGVENAVRSSAPACSSGMTMYADVPVSARLLTLDACRNGVCSRGRVELPNHETTNSGASSGPGTSNALVFALSGGVPGGALLTLRGAVEDSAFAQQKLEHPTLIPRATAEQRALEVRLVPAEPVRDGDRYALSLFLDGAATPSLKAEQTARYEPSPTDPDCKNGALKFSATTLPPAPQ